MLSILRNLRIRDPLVFFCLVVLIGNDHILKHSSLAGVVTGKLSDFSGLFFFPFFLYDLFRLLSHQAHNLKIFKLIVLLTAGLFLALKTSDTLILGFRWVYQALGSKAEIIKDPTDLMALVVLPFAVLWERELISRRKE